jgi:Transposase
MYVGWDWASQRHDVTVIDDTGQLVDRWTLAHTEAGIDQAMTRLAGHGRPDDLRVAIEATSGIVVDRLLAAGHPVVPIHPNSFNAARPRWGASKAKSDPGDSFKLADYLRTDGHRLRAAPVAVDQLDPRSWPTASASRSGCCAACLAASPTWIGPWPPPWASIPRPRSSSRCLASARSTWPRSWPRSARSRTGPVTSPTPLPRLVPPRSPSSPARAPWSSSAGQPIPVPATPWASSPTTAATPLRGQPTCTGKPAGAASATPRPSAS